MFFVKDGEVIKKYKIEIDIEKLEKLKLEIIDNCSLITHVKTTSWGGSKNKKIDRLLVRNYEMKFLEEIDTHNEFGPPRESIYEVTYDKYDPPEIVALINRALHGNDEHKIELLNYTPPMREDIQSQIDELLKDTSDLHKLQDNIEKVNKLIEQKEVNKNQKDVSVYLLDVKSCIKVILIEEMDFEVYLKACAFLDDSKTLVDKEKICIKA